MTRSTASISLSLICPILIVYLLLGTACSDQVPTQYRFIDLIKSAEIESPLTNLPENSHWEAQALSALKSGKEKLKQIVEKYTNRDLTFGNNTYPFALKVTLASELRSVLFAPTPSTYRFTLKIPQNARFDFGYGVMAESWEDGSAGVDFEITLIDTNEKSHALFSESINPNRSPADRTWFDRRINLSAYANQEIILEMKTGRIMPTETEGAPSSKPFVYAVWSNPTLFSVGKADNKLNVIMISYDTLRADHLGCYGYKRDTSPNLDQFAKNATLFKNAFSTASWTIPSHASIFTSLLPSAHGATVDTSDESNRKMPLADTHLTLTEILRGAGYATAAFTGDGFVASSLGFHQGFDTYYGERVIENIFHRATSWLEQHRSRKFFLFLHTYEIHTPYNRHIFTTDLNSGRFSAEGFNFKPPNRKDTPEHTAFLDSLRTATPEEKAYIMALYDGGIYYADQFMGTLLRQIERLKLRKNTLIVFFSDHGEEFWDRYPQMSGMHGHSPYDELLHVPLIISIPQGPAGQIIDQPVSLIDVFPTLLDVLDVPYDGRRIHGSSLTPLIAASSPQTNNRVAYSEDLYWGPNRQSIRTDTFRYVYTPDLTEIGDDYTGIDFFNTGAFIFGEMHQEELYNLISDPKEDTDIAAQDRSLTAAFRRRARDVFGIVTAHWSEDSLEVVPQNVTFGPNTVLVQLEGAIKSIEAVDVVTRDGEKWDTKDCSLKMVPSETGDVYLVFDDSTHTQRDIYLIHIHYRDKETTRLTVQRK